MLEKLLLYRHCHTENCEMHDLHTQAHDHGRSGTLIVVGDTVHSFVGDFLILLHPGYSRVRALAMNLMSSAATLVGGVIGNYGLQYFVGFEPVLLGWWRRA